MRKPQTHQHNWKESTAQDPKFSGKIIECVNEGCDIKRAFLSQSDVELFRQIIDSGEQPIVAPLPERPPEPNLAEAMWGWVFKDESIESIEASQKSKVEPDMEPEGTLPPHFIQAIADLLRPEYQRRRILRERELFLAELGKQPRGSGPLPQHLLDWFYRIDADVKDLTGQTMQQIHFQGVPAGLERMTVRRPRKKRAKKLDK